MATQKITAASIIASGRVKITKTPEQARTRHMIPPFGRGAIISKRAFYSDKPHGMLAVTPIPEMNQKDLDREMAVQLRRLSRHYEGLTIQEREG